MRRLTLSSISTLTKVVALAVIASMVLTGVSILPVSSASGTETPITHVVIIIQENHTFFNYWGDYPGVEGGVASATCQKYKNGTTLCPYETNNPDNTGPLSHSGTSADTAYNNGAMNQFLVANDNQEVMSYFNANVLGYYWGLAEHYTLMDQFFSSYLSYSLPNHWAAISGNSPAIAITNVGKTLSNNASTAELIEQASEIETMLEALQSGKSISVKYYDNTIKYNSLTQAIEVGGDSYVISYWNPSLEKTDTYTTLKSDFVPRTNIITDASSGNLPAVSWVIPNELDSEHPPHSVEAGEQWVQSVVDAIMNGPDWSSTAIFIMTDDWGGFYDPIVPPTLPNISPGGTNGLEELGFRVSALLVSPYARAGIDNTAYSFESVLSFIDYNWNLPSLNARVGASNNITVGAFNFNQAPLSPWLGTPLTHNQMGNVMAIASLDLPDPD